VEKYAKNFEQRKQRIPKLFSRGTEDPGLINWAQHGCSSRDRGSSVKNKVSKRWKRALNTGARSVEGRGSR